MEPCRGHCTNNPEALPTRLVSVPRAECLATALLESAVYFVEDKLQSVSLLLFKDQIAINSSCSIFLVLAVAHVSDSNVLNKKDKTFL